jgi:hypothetical protein
MFSRNDVTANEAPVTVYASMSSTDAAGGSGEEVAMQLMFSKKTPGMSVEMATRTALHETEGVTSNEAATTISEVRTR